MYTHTHTHTIDLCFLPRYGVFRRRRERTPLHYCIRMFRRIGINYANFIVEIQYVFTITTANPFLKMLLCLGVCHLCFILRVCEDLIETSVELKKIKMTLRGIALFEQCRFLKKEVQMKIE